ncbi:hypothetical protein QYE76_025480 [Lolium multiflorum]|uniref:CCHC-type domain-containing protein n=1 Tax=Lolium multiflorum TaxID=4521 RepID=A0AAD8RIM7_LOLMU|nr:hypothetical protein QYE76_025480 [Lolium multiflorum]
MDDEDAATTTIGDKAELAVFVAAAVEKVDRNFMEFLSCRVRSSLPGTGSDKSQFGTLYRDEVMPSSSTCWLPGAWLGACGAMAPLVPPYPALLVPVMVMELVGIFPGLAVVAVTRALPHHVVASPPRRMVFWIWRKFRPNLAEVPACHFQQKLLSAVCAQFSLQDRKFRWSWPEVPASGTSAQLPGKFRNSVFVALASNELWRIIMEGFKPYNPDKLTRREAVDSQLNVTALHMIQTSVGTKELHRVRNYTTAKEAWDGLTSSCIGSESTRRNKYNALKNKAEGFMRLPDEDHEDMYGRLLTVADAFRLVGATHINDSWIKEKYIECMMPFVPIDVKTLVGRECYSSLTSQQVVHELQALKVLEETSHDSRNRAIGMAKGSNLALVVNSVEEVIPQESYRASWSMTYPEDLQCHYHDHMAFHAKSFWVDPSKAKEDNIKRNNKNGFTSFGPKTRSCYNCDDKRHFIAECPIRLRQILVRKYSRNWTKSKPRAYFSTKLPEVRRRDEEGRRGGHTLGRRGPPWPRGPVVWGPVPPLDLPFRLQIASVTKPPVPRTTIRKTFRETPPPPIPSRGIQEIASGTLPRGESSPGGLYAAMVASGVMCE